MNQYEHLIAFERVAADSSYYKPSQTHNALAAKPGDRWRWLVPKSIAQGIDERNLAIGLVKDRYRATCNDPWQENVIRYTVGGIRKQESEKYVELKIRVGDLPNADDWKQFALVRSNGQTVLGTFTGQQTTKAAYMKALADFYEAFPYTKVMCNVSGSLLRIRIWEKTGVLKLADEGLVIGLGKTTVTNTNQPQLNKTHLGQKIYAAQDSYEVVVGSSVQEGNVYTINDVSYVAAAGDTAATVKLALLNGGGVYLIESGESMTVLAVAGTRRIQNTNSLTIQAVFHSDNVGNDRYLIAVTGTPQPGNQIVLSATGKVTRSYTVQEGDTNTDIEAAFNIDSGFYEVSDGVIPSVSFVPAFQDVTNTNNPTLVLSGLTVIPSYTVEQYRVIVGADVRAGNVYVLDDLTYTATADDTALTVAEALGKDSISFTIEVDEGVNPLVYAQPGYAYGIDQIADVTIVDGPKLARSSQYIVEADFACDIEQGVYRLAVLDTRPENAVILSLGNYINISSRAKGEIVEVSDRGDVFGFEYYESGLTQRMRLPIFMGPPTQQVESDRIVEYLGGYRSTTKRIEYISELITKSGYGPFHRLLATFLQHKTLWIGGKPYQMPGDYEESTLSSGTDFRQGKAQLVDLRAEKNNYSGYRTNDYQSGIYGGFCKVSLVSGLAGVDIWLQSTEFDRQLSEGSALINSDSYRITLETQDYVKLQLYRNGELYLTAQLPKGQRVRLMPWLRLETGQDWILATELTDACVTEPTITYHCEDIQVPSVELICESVDIPENGAFSDAYSNDYTI